MNERQTKHAPRLGEVPGRPEADWEKYMYAAFAAAKAIGASNVDALRFATGATWEPGQ